MKNNNIEKKQCVFIATQVMKTLKHNLQNMKNTTTLCISDCKIRIFSYAFWIEDCNLAGSTEG